jgi:chaperonin GroEL
MLEDIAILTGGKAIIEGPRHRAREASTLETSASAKKVDDRQGQHHDHRGRRARPTAIKGRMRPDPRRDRDDRPATTTARSSRSAWPKLAGGVAQIKVGAVERDRAEGEEGARRGRAARHARRGRRGRRRRRRHERTSARCPSLEEAPQGLRRATRSRGVEAVAEALCVPLRTIAENAGEKGTVVVAKVKEMKGDEGFNALTRKYGDLVKQGVITPAKVDRTALQNAASVAGLHPDLPTAPSARSRSRRRPRARPRPRP